MFDTKDIKLLSEGASFDVKAFLVKQEIVQEELLVKINYTLMVIK